MSQLKKIIVSAIIGILAILGIYTNANAYEVGQNITITYNQYKTNDNIFCAEHGQALKSSNSYKIISQVKITGNKSTDHLGNTRISWDNAKMAYILSQDNGANKDSGEVANSVWNYLYTWLTNVGQYHAGLYRSFSNGKPGTQSWLDTESTNYANNYREDNTQIVDNTNKNNIKVTAYQWTDGKSYIRVGPFNWSFPGNMTNATVRDQNGKAINGISFSSFRGNEEYWYGANGIKSGKDFYITFPMSTDITKITSITGEARTSVKNVNIWFLQASAGYKQNLIIREPGEEPLDIKTTFNYDISTQGHLQVIKINKDNQAVKLPGVTFHIQHKNTGKYVHRDEKNKISYVNSKEEASVFTTDDKGEILIENLIVGTYVAYEIENPNYGYEMLTEGVEHDVVVDKTEKFVISNKQIYVKLSGYVWVDKGDGKKADRNDLFKTPNSEQPDSQDILFNGITVRLKDRETGETLQETVTSKLDRYKDSINDGNGEYLFMDVLIEKLKDYYIEFEYDGLTYTNVVPHIEKDTGSKSAEKAEGEGSRDEFNKNFSVVEGSGRNTGYTRDANGNEKHQLAYNIDESKHTATLINNGQYTITANTDVPDYKIRNHFTFGQEEIRYINLGLYEREQPDIALTKDLENVRVTINGYEHTYVYAQRFLNAGEYGDGFNVGVKFGSKYGSMSYSRAIYKADYEYRNENDQSKELKVYVTYKLTMRNKSDHLVTQVNQLVDYYDSKYELLAVGNKLDEKGRIVKGEMVHKEEDYNGKYKKTTIQNNTRLEAEKEDSIYVEFALNREAVLNVLNNKANLDNVAEIASYSIFDGNKVYAGIDKNSNPGNSVPGDTRTYEDDTDASPALKLEVADAREMAGKVFLDETSGDLMTGKTRLGDGKYTENEKGIEGVDITLTETTGSGKVYTAKTDSNGDFLIKDYIPGDYTLTYTWGDKTYTVQNYKGTIYNDKDRQNNKKWYKENVDTRLSDAMDNLKTAQEAPKGSREQIDDEIKNVTNQTDSKITRTKMDSTTPMMGIGVEYETTYTASMGDRYIYKVANIDLGIVERARQDLALKKRVKTLKATLANGQVIVNLEIDEDGNVTGEKNGITYMGPNPNIIPSNGFIRLELDNELIQGTVLEVGYEIKATNQSELDYLSDNYYLYGIVEGPVVTIEPTGIIDYLDKNWAFDSDKNPQWQVKTLDEIKNIVAETVYNNPESTINEKMILYTESLKGKQLKPTEFADVMLHVSKILTTTDEISLDNETEIAELTKTGGSKPQSTPGNYVPGKAFMETDDSMAETTIVTPATGENQNYMVPIMIGTFAFVVLGAGVVIIKKKVLDK